MIHQAEVVVGVGIPWPLDLQRTGRLAAIGVAQIRGDAAILALEFLDRVEGRVSGEIGDRRIQSAAGDQQQRKARPRLLVADANGAVFVKRHAGSSLPGPEAPAKQGLGSTAGRRTEGLALKAWRSAAARA